MLRTLLKRVLLKVPVAAVKLPVAVVQKTATATKKVATAAEAKPKTATAGIISIGALIWLVQTLIKVYQVFQ